jgi:hypothetical protein
VVNYSNYITSVKLQHKRPSWGVVTNITTKPHAKSQFKVMFSTKDLVDMDAMPHIQQLIERANDVLYTPFDMTPPTEEEEREEKF